ncbi:MAG: Ig-like domain-containing protein [Candidatus Marinimicrobia bacterium]|nr:Ig-like domain-containing protein [Candidatus Neomarinimicrobiota bacterium]
MRYKNLARLLPSSLFLLAFIAVIISCEDTMEQDEVSVAELSRVTPVDGAVNINPDASISIEFTEGMDSSSCQSRFGVFMGDLDEIPTNMMGQMHGMMNGQFQWNDDQTIMTFHPDSMFMDSTMYSICIQEGMQMHHHGGGGMMNMNHMGNNGSTASNGIISRFHTRN